MAWREKLQVGSFRGARFFWQRAEGEVGRKTARHDYPLRDDCYVEDLGMAPPEFTLDVLVIGPDYMTDRDKLVRALQEPGPGTLVHPTMGTLRVALNGKVRITESTREGGLCRFSIPFVAAGENRYPASRTDTPTRVALSASNLYGVALSTLARYWWMVRMPAYVVQSAVSSVLGAADTMLQIARLAPGVVPDLAFTAKIAALKADASALVSVPDTLAARLAGPVLAFSDLTDDAAWRYRYCRALYGYGTDFAALPLTISARRRQAQNRDALTRLVRLTAIEEAAIAASEIEFASYQEAIAYRDELCAAIDAEMELEDTPDDAFAALTDLRASVVTDIHERGANLARIVSYTPAATLPALVISHTIYGDAGKADDIIARNRVRRPLFVSGGDGLEVLVYD